MRINILLKDFNSINKFIQLTGEFEINNIINLLDLLVIIFKII